MSNVEIYALGSLLVSLGLGYGVYSVAGGTWALVTVAVVLGYGLRGAVKRGRRPEVSPD